MANPTDTLILTMSEDAYLGNAQFTVAVGGKQIGGIFSTAASHAAGAHQNFTFHLDAPVGNLPISVSFINDYWGGSPATDRNLYVDNVTYDGVSTGQSAVLLGNGAAGFLVADHTPIPGATISGTPGNDVLIGTGGDDRIIGGAGNDTINGMGGDDFLYGGEGNDAFRFPEGSGHDVILDFQWGLMGYQDKIGLTRRGITPETFARDVHITNVGDGRTQISIAGSTDTIILPNVAPESITLTDFNLS